TGASVADIRAFLASHRVGAVLMAEQPRGSDARRTLAAATGTAGVRSGRVVVFQVRPGPRAGGEHRAPHPRAAPPETGGRARTSNLPKVRPIGFFRAGSRPRRRESMSRRSHR